MRNGQALANFNNGSREKRRQLPVWATPYNSSPRFYVINAIIKVVGVFSSQIQLKLCTPSPERDRHRRGSEQVSKIYSSRRAIWPLCHESSLSLCVYRVERSSNK